MRKTLGSIDGKMQGALDWLRDPTAMQVVTIKIILDFRVNLSKKKQYMMKTCRVVWGREACERS